MESEAEAQDRVRNLPRFTHLEAQRAGISTRCVCGEARSFPPDRLLRAAEPGLPFSLTALQEDGDEPSL